MDERNVVGVSGLKFMVVSKETNVVEAAFSDEFVAENVFKNNFDSASFELVKLLDELGYKRR